ncbi:MAG: hypothetical protein HUU35_10985 [Armatimonadetes bacterium]|nr:hypothetical protein [Armatimonadota bacterium]
MARGIGLLGRCGLLVVLAVVPLAAQDDLQALSDEFDDEATLANWKRIHQTEGWNADQLERFDINRTRQGVMMLVPYTNVWYRDYRGELVYKDIEGDFVATTRLYVTRRGGGGAPRSSFSLGGILVRAPREVTPTTWQPGGENYIFLSLGAASQPGQYQWEVKTTVNSNSQLQLAPAGGAEGQIRIARIGSSLILLRRAPQQSWQVHQRYQRSDFPTALQVGVTAYTDWPTCQRYQPQDHNGRVIRDGRPDLEVQYDYVRFQRPAVPESLRERNLMDRAAVPDSALLAFLGDAADQNG